MATSTYLPSGLPTGTVEGGDVSEKILMAVNYLLTFAGILAILFIVYAGIVFITSGGNEARVKTAKSTLTWSIIGLAVVLLSYLIVNFVIDFLTDIII